MEVRRRCGSLQWTATGFPGCTPLTSGGHIIWRELCFYCLAGSCGEGRQVPQICSRRVSYCQIIATKYCDNYLPYLISLIKITLHLGLCCLWLLIGMRSFEVHGEIMPDNFEPTDAIWNKVTHFNPGSQLTVLLSSVIDLHFDNRFTIFFRNVQSGTASSSKAQNKVPLPDQQVALALMLELSVQRGSLSHLLQVRIINV